tara:strand:+ start:414 stop:1433 length:1020 start_codon:yes stop_codon:yes gene_type:complete
MNKIITTIFLLTSITFFPQEINNDSILQIKINDLETKVSNFDNNIKKQSKKLNELTNSIQSFQVDINTVSIDNKTFADSITKIITLVDSRLLKLDSIINILSQDINANKIDNNSRFEVIIKESENLKNELDAANDNVTKIENSSSKNADDINLVNNDLSQKQQYGLIIIAFSIILILIVYLVLSRKWNNDTKKLSNKQKEILEKQIQDSQKLADWLGKETEQNLGNKSSGEPEHSFAKRVADEIVRITTNLSRMDESVKGHRQLSASVRKLEQTLNANKYELVKLLNQPYNEGMIMQATMVVDDSLNPGESIISRIIKPQINYKGKLIQAAQVEVSVGE